MPLIADALHVYSLPLTLRFLSLPNPRHDSVSTLASFGSAFALLSSFGGKLGTWLISVTTLFS